MRHNNEQSPTTYSNLSCLSAVGEKRQKEPGLSRQPFSQSELDQEFWETVGQNRKEWSSNHIGSSGDLGDPWGTVEPPWGNGCDPWHDPASARSSMVSKSSSTAFCRSVLVPLTSTSRKGPPFLAATLATSSSYQLLKPKGQHRRRMANICELQTWRISHCKGLLPLSRNKEGSAPLKTNMFIVDPYQRTIPNFVIAGDYTQIWWY